MEKEMQRNLPAQELARRSMEQVAAEIKPGMTERQVAVLAEEKMRDLGSEGWWYHNVGALVLAGKNRSKLSVSGRDYRPSEEVVLGENDLVSLDFSPIVNGCWGDYARTIYIEEGRAKLEPEAPESPLFREGFEMELRLHLELMEWVRPETTYEEVAEHMNRILRDDGFENMDFHGNLGHSIEHSPGDRIYLEPGNKETLGGHGTPFTFEPHIAKKGGEWGFKREQIYVFGEDGRIRPL
ncbi:MAG: aminopeptidase P family protein [Lachnospiraceae bacterium]|nr:aminopeptidase P family protein [Lachnospiraceae bacterium]